MVHESTLHKLAAAANQRHKEKDYWLNKLSGKWVKSRIPQDYYRRNSDNHWLEAAVFEFSESLSSALIQLSRGSDVRLYVVLVAALSVLLHRSMDVHTDADVDSETFTGYSDIVVGTPILKQEKEVDFINTLLVLRNVVCPHMTFKEVLLDVRQTIIDAMEHQNYPMEILARQLNMPFSAEDEFPLSDIAVLVENIHDRKYINHVNLNMIFSFNRSKSTIRGRLEYNPLLYRETTIEQIINRFKHILQEVLSNVDIPLSDIEIMSEEEKRRLLIDFNDRCVDYPREKTIHELFEEQAERRPGSAAVVGPGCMKAWMPGAVHITYRELNKRSDRLARLLKGKGVGPDTVVGIMAERFLEMIIGILGILKAGGAYLPINPNHPEERKEYMLEDSKAKVLLTAPASQFKVKEESIELIDISEPVFSSTLSHVSSANIAYLIYTSGTTGRPKGVLVGHQNVVRLVKNTDYIRFRENDRILQTGALEFDASTFEIWGSLLNGLTLVLVSEEEVLNPEMLKLNIRKYDISTMWLTSSFFNQLCGEDVDIFEGLRNLLVGGDVLSPMHINRVRRRFPVLTILNGYGPTENTTFSTVFSIEEEYEERIPIGRPIANSTAYIVDRWHGLVPVGLVGELWVGGDGVARGYLNRPELTAEKFDQDLWDYRDYRDLKKNEKKYKQKLNQKFFGGSRGAILQKSPPGLLYKTGDLARWLPDGNIEFIGRIDHQIKIRGFRIEPGEIESRLLKHDRIKEAVVLVRQDGKGDKYLCAYVVSQRVFGVSELREYLSEDLPDYMIPSYIIKLDEMPLTPNGKIDRAALPIPKPGGTAAVRGGTCEAPRNQWEWELVEIWAGILNIDRENLDIDTNFFEAGGHSLRAASLASTIHKVFGVDIGLTEVFNRPTIRELSGYIEAAKLEKYLSIEPTERKEYYPLSSAQKRLYILQQMEVSSTAYNIPYFMSLEGDLETVRFGSAFKKLVDRHESLRTSFEMVGDDPVQRIHVDGEFEIEYYDCKVEVKNPDACLTSQEGIVRDFIRPFDLSLVPLFRVGLIKKERNKYILMVDMHHIISDGTSIGVLVREFGGLYGKGILPPARIQYKDFSEWQNSKKEREILITQERYWLKEFAGEVPVLHLSLDYTRPLVQDFGGDAISFRIDDKQTQQLRILALRGGASLYMVLLTVYYVFLSKLSGDEDIVVGSPVTGRRHGDLQNIIGMFVNTLALRNYPGGEKPFREFLREVRERTLAAFENQDYPFEDLVEKIAVHRDVSRNPLFDVMFALQNMDISELRIPGLELSPYEHEVVIAKFDMSWDCVESEEGLLFSVTYCTKLFKAETIERFINYFKKIVTSMLEDPQVKIADIEIISEEEKEQVLHRFNDSRVEYWYNKRVHELFEEQAARTPKKIALHGCMNAWMHEGGHITYHELNKKSDQLAHVLKEKGVLTDSIIGIMVEPSIEMIIGILGILKAGGAYLPLDPNYPQERIEYMLKDSKVKVLLTLSVNQFKEKEDLIDIIDISEGLSFSTSTSTLTLSKVSSANLAYIIYTSGTTGRPKGVAVEHGNLTAYLDAFENEFNLRSDDTVIQQASFTFDAFVEELYPILLKGGKLVIPAREVVVDMDALGKFIAKHCVTMITCSPQLLNELNNTAGIDGPDLLASIRIFISGGDRLKSEYIGNLPGSALVYNTYGPTETTVCATYYKCREDRNPDPPIGKPIAGYRVYIMSPGAHQLQPVGIPGELCIQGAGVARGYLNQPELTAEKFIEYRSYRSYRTYISYKTGDLGRWLPDGNIEFLGRIDRQVKIRGYRIELGEIEKRLSNHVRVKEAVAVVRDAGERRENYICVYIVPQPSMLNHSPDVSELRDYLTSELPEYMIPSYFIPVDRIPLTPNGKIERRALPAPEHMRSYLKTTYVQAETEKEMIVADTWKEVLGIDKVGLNDNFFELGGNSLNIIQLSHKLKKNLGKDIPTVTLFRFPKIGSFLDYLDHMEESEKQVNVDATANQQQRAEVVRIGKEMMKRSLQKRREKLT
jgi:amino acid adenylation domain-containing protein